MPIDWGNASDDDIIRAYRERFGGDVSAITGYTEDGTERLEASYQQSIDWYNQFRQRTGRAPTKEEWAQEISFETGMGYDKALQAHDYWRNWQGRSGKGNPTKEEWVRGLRQVQPGLGQTPTLSREELEEQRRRFDVEQGNWGKTFEEQKRQFDTSQRQQGEQFGANLLGQLTGPQDWIKYQIAQASIGKDLPANLYEAMQRTPSFGAMQGTRSWEDEFQDYWGRVRQGPGDTGQPPMDGGPTPVTPPYQVPAQRWQPPAQVQQDINLLRSPNLGRQYPWQPGAQGGNRAVRYIGPPEQQPGVQTVSNDEFWRQSRQQPSDSAQRYGTSETGRQFIQPTALSTPMLNRMTPSQRQMVSGEVSAAGLPVDDYWDRVRRAQPQGSASTRTRWT